MSIFKDANQNFREKKYVKALELFERAGEIYGRNLVDANILLCKKAIKELNLNNLSFESAGLKPNKAIDIPVQEEVFLDAIYKQIDDAIAGGIQLYKKNNSPLVTVVVTSHNTENYIESCLESLLSQSYRNLEIVVIDDASEDGTVDVVNRVARGNGRIKLLRLCSNLGTYYAKNLGIKRSRGEVIFFQDSDDISHPHRISLMMHVLIDSPNAKIARGAYSRIDPLTSRIIAVNGLFKKLGLITLGVKREVFEEVGYFNCTTKASDDEFFNRALHYLGKPAIVNLDLPLYYNTMRDGSLFADMVKWKSDGSIQQQASPSRQAYVETFKELHSRVNKNELRKVFAFPRIRDAMPVKSDMTKLANPRLPVIVNLCSIPERESKLERVLRSVALQCDKINIYLDRYESEPKFLKKLGVEVNIYCSQNRPGLRDNGKFIALEEMSQSGKDAYYFTIDDDIEYPVDYVNSMIKSLEYFDSAVVVGVHGVILKDKPKGYFSDRRMVHSFIRSLERSKLVNVLGTGTMAFRASLFNNFSLTNFKNPGMVDLYVAVMCMLRSIPQICIARPDGWLSDLGEDGDPTLFAEFKGSDNQQRDLILSHGPWGNKGICEVVDKIVGRMPHLEDRLRCMLPALTAVTMAASV